MSEKGSRFNPIVLKHIYDRRTGIHRIETDGRTYYGYSRLSLSHNLIVGIIITYGLEANAETTIMLNDTLFTRSNRTIVGSSKDGKDMYLEYTFDIEGHIE